MEGPVRFGNAPTFDSALFATAREYAEHLLAGETLLTATPRSTSPTGSTTWPTAARWR